MKKTFLLVALVPAFSLAQNKEFAEREWEEMHKNLKYAPQPIGAVEVYSFTCLGTIAKTNKEYQEAMERCDFIRDSTKAAKAVIGEMAMRKLKKQRRKNYDTRKN